ncbi:MAG: hypothetical protein GF308_00590 [Candidatus Heimdallarchaeota archaeon]|nr:hypothetical protein [Candidatus Heimdallarchaeota archaeon]
MVKTLEEISNYIRQEFPIKGRPQEVQDSFVEIMDQLMIIRPNLKGVRIGQTTNPDSEEFHRMARRTICLLLYETTNEKDADEVDLYISKQKVFPSSEKRHRVVDLLTIGSEKSNYYIYLALNKRWKFRKVFGPFSRGSS